MAAESNLNNRADIAKILSLDYAFKFQGQIDKILECLGVTEKIAMKEGDQIKTYSATVTEGSTSVAEGDVIPLSNVELAANDPVTITLKKRRKSVSAESIQASGYEEAVVKTDEQLLRTIQKGIRADFFTFLATGTGTAEGTNFQTALANAWAGCQVAFEDDAVEVVAFAHPNDVAAYLGAASITVQDVFGMKYLTGFTDVKGVFLSSLVAEGTLIATAVENIKFAYIDINGNLKEAFPGLESDESGYIGIWHDAVSSRATLDSVFMSGATLFPEILDGVIIADFTE